MRMLLQSLKALRQAPGGAGSIWKYLESLARASGVFWRFASGFRTELHLADVVLAMGPGNTPAVWVGPEIWFYRVLDQFKNLTRFDLSGLLTGRDLILRLFSRVVHTEEPHFCELRTLAPIHDWSSDRITIWSIRIRCISACSVTAHSPDCDPNKIRGVTTKIAQISSLFCSHSPIIHQIAKWRIAGIGACKSESCIYISYCDTIRTQLLKWSQSSEMQKMSNQPKNHGFGGVPIFDVVNSVEIVRVRLQPRRGTEPRI